MWEIISNPVTLSVIVMCVLCLCKLNVILSLLVSAMVAGFAAGMGPGEIMGGYYHRTERKWNKCHSLSASGDVCSSSGTNRTGDNAGQVDCIGS